MHNGLYTNMLLGAEWNAFAAKRKPVCVTSPAGQQRSTYWLALPYWYSIPLLVCSFLLHWLVSQAFFFMRISVYSAKGEELAPFVSCGYSVAPIILVIILQLCLFLAVVVTGCRRYSPGPPLAASCSAAISAACHGLPSRDRGGEPVSRRPLQWGAMPSLEGSSNVGHCGIRVEEVCMPVDGRVYAGLSQGIRHRPCVS